MDGVVSERTAKKTFFFVGRFLKKKLQKIKREARISFFLSLSLSAF